MNSFVKTLNTVLFVSIMSVTADSALAAGLSGCSYDGIPLNGKVKVVNSFPDIKVEVVSSFEDLDVQAVNSFPDRCGKWKFVDNFPDFTVQFVNSFPDIKIKFVDNFPGLK